MKLNRVVVDLAKQVFQVHGLDRAGRSFAAPPPPNENGQIVERDLVSAVSEVLPLPGEAGTGDDNGL